MPVHIVTRINTIILILNLTDEIIDAFFSYVSKEFAGRKKYITVFGGEPLLGSPKQKELISYLLKKSVEADLEVSFVTNGYSLEEYSEILKTGKIQGSTGNSGWY